MSLADDMRGEIDRSRRAGVDVRELPGLAEVAVDSLVQRFGRLSENSRGLLLQIGGFEIRNAGRRLPARVDFAEDYNFGWDALPRAFPLAMDGFGNTWVADASNRDGDLGPVLFVSHDPPVLVVQAPDLPTFVRQCLSESGARDVVHSHVDRLWDDRGLPHDRHRRDFAEPDLQSFASSLPDDWRVIDLRSMTIGSGFALLSEEVTKHPRQLIFGIPAGR